MVSSSKASHTAPDVARQPCWVHLSSSLYACPEQHKQSGMLMQKQCRQHRSSVAQDIAFDLNFGKGCSARSSGRALCDTAPASTLQARCRGKGDSCQVQREEAPVLVAESCQQGSVAATITVTAKCFERQHHIA